jgi:hypothetical protein
MECKVISLREMTHEDNATQPSDTVLNFVNQKLRTGSHLQLFENKEKSPRNWLTPSAMLGWHKY